MKIQLLVSVFCMLSVTTAFAEEGDAYGEDGSGDVGSNDQSSDAPPADGTLNDQTDSAMPPSDGGVSDSASESPEMAPQIIDSGTCSAEPGKVVYNWVTYAETAKTGGSLSWRLNNPGNLMCTPAQYKAGGGANFKCWPNENQPLRIYFTMADGLTKLKNHFKDDKGGCTLKQHAFGTSCGRYGNAGQEAEYLSTWTRSTGASENTLFRDLTDDQLEKLIKATIQQEHFSSGEEKDRAEKPGSGMPADVFCGR